jgi:hypothetical protein
MARSAVVFVSWMNAAALSWAAAFSPRVFNCVPPATVQSAMREQFLLWGLPGGLRLDNGLPWGGGAGNDLPSAMALWLVGLGLALTFNPPRQPRYNGVVEKSHETSQRWSEPHKARSVLEWQQNVDVMDRRQRESYPYQGRRSRLEVYPQLAHSGRAYSAGWEEENWNVQRAREYLAGHVAHRQVDSGGRVSLYNRDRYIGTRHSGKIVVVRYDPEACEWFVSEPGVGELRRLEAPEICRERILALDISVKKTAQRKT